MLTPLKQALATLFAGGTLSADEMAGALSTVMRGEATGAQIGALLALLRQRGESQDELLGAALALRDAAVRLDHGLPLVLDTCGTGGDGAHTFNISTTAALVCAGAGVPVAKHGNRAISSRAGSADVLEALGVPLESDPDVAVRRLRDVGFTFLFAPAYHPAMRHVAAARRELGVRTIMNLLGPLASPARATHQLVGVYDKARLVPIARVLDRLGVRAVVVHGDNGLDELSPAGETHYAEATGDTVRTGITTPEAIGLVRWPLDAIRGGDAEENARILVRVLDGELGPYRDATLQNAAWALYVAGRAASPTDGVAVAALAIDSGRARAVLEAARTTEPS